jgi:putative ABC transport system permease protein
MIKLFLIAARNLMRNKGRTLLTVLGAAVAVLAFVMLRTVLWAWTAAAEYSAKDRIATRHKVSFVISLPKHYVETIRQVPGVKQVTYMNWFGGKNPKKPQEFFATIAVDPPTFLEVMDEIQLPPDQKQKWLEDRKGAIIGDVLAKQLGLKVGDKFTVQGSIYPGDWEFNIDGIYTAARKSVDRSTFWFHWNYVNETLPEGRKDEVGWITSRIDDPGRSGDISAAIDKIFDEKDTQTATMSERAMNLSFMGMISALLTALDIISFIILLIMMMILGNTIAMGVRERTREYAVLRAVGFLPHHIALFVLGEAVALGLLAGLVGLGLSYPVVELGMGRFLEENMGAWFPYFRIPNETFGLALGLTVGLALVASAIPAFRASRLVVTDALRRVA